MNPFFGTKSIPKRNILWNLNIREGNLVTTTNRPNVAYYVRKILKRLMVRPWVGRFTDTAKTEECEHVVRRRTLVYAIHRLWLYCCLKHPGITVPSKWEYSFYCLAYVYFILLRRFVILLRPMLSFMRLFCDAFISVISPRRVNSIKFVSLRFQAGGFMKHFGGVWQLNFRIYYRTNGFTLRALPPPPPTHTMRLWIRCSNFKNTRFFKISNELET